MFSSNNKISVRQLQATLILYFLGIGAIFLPGIAVGSSGRDGWLSALLAVAFAVAACFLVMTAAFAVEGDSFHEIACKTLSRPLGKLVCVALAARLILDAGFKLRIFGEVVRQYLLPQTPICLTILVILALGGYAGFHGAETKGRAAEILVFLVVIPLLLLLVMGLFGANYTNLLPAFRTDGLQILSGGVSGGFAFSGLSFLLVAAPMLGSRDTHARRRVTGAVGFVGLLLAAFTFLSIIRLGEDVTASSERPLLALLFTIEIPGAFMERQGALVLALWIFTAFIMAAVVVTFGSNLLRETVGRGVNAVYVIAVIAVVFAVSLIPHSSTKALEYSKILHGFTEHIFVLLLPLVIIISGRLRTCVQ